MPKPFPEGSTARKREAPLNQIAATTVVLPSLGENVTEATITRWLTSRGDRIEEGEPVLEVSTDKVDTEVPSPTAGILVDILASEDTVVEVGGPLAMIGANAAGVTLPEPAPIVEPVTVSGADRVEKLPRIRRTIARRMVESLHTSAQLTTVVEIDVTGIARVRDREEAVLHARTGMKLSFPPFFVADAVEALGDHPVINLTTVRQRLETGFGLQLCIKHRLYSNQT